MISNRPDAIDKIADRRLQQAADQAVGRHQQAERGVADAKFRLEDREHRRQGQAIEMAHEMAGADQPHGLNLLSLTWYHHRPSISHEKEA
jgi:hypothetical protein